MRFRKFLPSHKKYQFGIINTIHVVGVDIDRNRKSVLIIETYFYVIQKRINITYLQLKHQGVHLRATDMRDTYTNSNINTFFKAQNESYQMTYAVKKVENLFTWCGHERYSFQL